MRRCYEFEKFSVNFYFKLCNILAFLPSNEATNLRFKITTDQSGMSRTFLDLAQATKLISQYGSPLYVYSKEAILKNVETLQQATKGFHLSYAMKANSNPEILKTIKNDGKGVLYVDSVSPGEIIRALGAGYPAENILYTENFINEEEIDFAIQKNVMLNVGALSTLEQFGKKLTGRSIFVRLNPDNGAGEHYKIITGGPQSKFGIPSKDIKAVIKIAQEHNIKIVGLHQHIGSNMKKADREIFIQTTKFVFEQAPLFKDVKYVNIGGGLGVKYREQEQLFDIKSFFDEIREIRDHYNKDLQIWLEPGRFFVADAGVLLCRITGTKTTTERNFYGTDTGFNHLIRPALYGSHHDIINLSPCDKPKQNSFICGNICECSDMLGENIMLAGKPGDILCIQNAGAYGFVMSSNYNERPRPAQVLLEGQEVRVIRRRETYADLEVRI